MNIQDIIFLINFILDIDEPDTGQFFAADMNEATQPGNLRERATRYEAWIARLPDNDREEIMGMYNTRKQEILNKEVKS